MRQSVVSRLALLAGAIALFAGPMACGSILGIGDPTVVDAGPTTGEGGMMDHTSSGGNHDATTDSPEDMAASEAGDVTVGDGEAGLEDGSEDVADAVASDGPDQTGDGGCTGGFVRCTPEGGVAGTGACTNLSSDPKNCSNCGSACAVNHNTPTCQFGGCGLGTCDTGFLDCNTSATDGCEVNQNTDPLNCGACGNICPTGQFCVMGTCGVTCPQTPTKESPCEKLPDGGATAFVDGGTFPLYCADLNADPTNCGACGKQCPTNNNTPVCTNGVCATGACDTGYLDCNGNPSDGCEVNQNTDPAHCGTCGISCSVTNGTPQCLNGSCAIAKCDTGSADCDHLYSTGCEVDTTTDKLNCGACNNSCATNCSGNVGSVTCAASTCTVATCAPSYYDIDGLCSDGCECQGTVVATCAAPHTVALSGPGTSTNVSGNLVPTAGTSDWYTVTFGNNKATNYHPHVVFQTNPSSEYVFDIEANCSGGNLVCGVEKNDAGVALHSTGLTAWETSYNAGVDFVDSGFIAIPSVGTIWVHVYRANGAPVDCASYTLTISD